MSTQQLDCQAAKKLQELILEEKVKGTPDIEIGKKYGVNFKYIEKLVTKSQGINISNLNHFKKIKTLQPKDFKEEQTTVWSFKQRGTWATHSGEYRGNWSPYIPRNVILKYSKPGELVLDYFCGAGTTAVEAKLLGRKCTALDINQKAIELARENLDFKVSSPGLPFLGKNHNPQIYEPKLLVGDARNLSFLPDDSVDLICAHPPYANILQYTDSKDGDLSFLDMDDFLKETSKVAHESFRVLKPGRQCAILIGDTRRKKNVIPLGFKLIDVYLRAGFKLKELIIKRQHNCKTTGFWYNNSIKYNFLLLAHEYLPIFEKPELSDTLQVNETIAAYGTITSTLVEPELKRKLDQLETTTVWVLPEIDFEKQLNKNVIERYSDDSRYSVIFLNLISKGKTGFEISKSQEGKELLFIKSPFLNNNSPHSQIELYLSKIKEIINQNLSETTDSKFIVIQTQDVRINGSIEPMAKRVVDLLKIDSLQLKEIILVTQENQKIKNQSSGSCLKINHQYLLVYEIKRC
ncbi:MAG: methyltransferase domain-containing protein [Candidatus Omnitrophica bacterium]|nr:methyltransferase domain-containing protein [Candidatus Omnitrophota bacterium]